MENSFPAVVGIRFRSKNRDCSSRFPNVSSHHCELEFVDGYWRVRDLNSRNGVKVNGVRCQTKWLLPGDVLSIAKHRYELVYEPRGDGKPPEDEDPFAIPLLEKAGLVRHPLPEEEDSEPPRRRYDLDLDFPRQSEPPGRSVESR